MRSQSGKAKAVPAINGLRAIAIVAVIWHHSFAPYFLSLGDSLAHGALNPLLGGGWLGVNLFFFLSGFVLYLPYVDRRDAFARGAEIKAFCLRRARRLLPLFYLSVFVGFFFFQRDFSVAMIEKFLATCSLLYTLNGETFFPDPNWVLWSLGVELGFSALFPLIVRAIDRHGLAPVVAASMALALAMRIVGDFVLHMPISEGLLNNVADGLFGRLDDFVLGMVGAAIYAGRIAPPERFARIAAPLGLGLFLLGMAIFDRVGAGKIDVGYAAFATSFINIGALCFVIGLFRTPWLDRALSARPLQVVGMMCYSLYIWHGLLLLAIFPGVKTDPLAVVGQIDKYPLFLAGLALVSVWTYRFVEFPGHDLRALFLLAPKPSPKPSPEPARENAAARLPGYAESARS